MVENGNKCKLSFSSDLDFPLVISFLLNTLLRTIVEKGRSGYSLLLNRLFSSLCRDGLISSCPSPCPSLCLVPSDFLLQNIFALEWTAPVISVSTRIVLQSIRGAILLAVIGVWSSPFISPLQ